VLEILGNQIKIPVQSTIRTMCVSMTNENPVTYTCLSFKEELF
jgi:hypothetical protein